MWEGAMLPCPPPSDPNFQSVISQTNNGCSLLSLILAKLLLLDIPVSCENIFALSIVTALTARPFLIKKCGKMCVSLVKTAKICWRLGTTPPDPLCQILGEPLNSTVQNFYKAAETVVLFCNNSGLTSTKKEKKGNS